MGTEDLPPKPNTHVTARQRMRRTGEYTGGPVAYGLDIECRMGDEVQWRYVVEGPSSGVRIVGDREVLTDCTPRRKRSRRERVYLVPTIREDRLRVLNQIFSWFASEAIGEYRIAARLNEREVPALNGKEWTGPGILYILSNPVYVGLPSESKRSRSEARSKQRVEGEGHAPINQTGLVGGTPPDPLFKPIIDPKLFAEVQERLASWKKREKTAPKSERSWLSDLMFCARCEVRMWGEEATEGKFGTPDYRTVPAYRCSTYRRDKDKCMRGCRAYTVKHCIVEEELRKVLDSRGDRIERYLDPRREDPSHAMVRGEREKFAALDLIDSRMEDFIVRHVAEGVPPIVHIWGKVDPDKWEENEYVDPDERFEVVGDEGYTELLRVEQCYRLVHDARREMWAMSLIEKRAQFERLMGLFKGMDPENERAIASMQISIRQTESEIAELEGECVQLDEEASTIKGELVEIKHQLREARWLLGAGSPRQKAEAVSRVIKEIRCHFRHTAKSSKVERLDFVLISGEIIPRRVGK